VNIALAVIEIRTLPHILVTTKRIMIAVYTCWLKDVGFTVVVESIPSRSSSSKAPEIMGAADDC
jgi:hypothetical protein